MSRSSGFGDSRRSSAARPRERERVHELRRVQHLDRQPAADLDLLRVLRVEGRVGAEAGRCRPVAHGVRAVLVEHARGRDDVALRLRHLLAVGVDDEAGDAGVLPRHRAVLELGAQHGREQPGADDVLALAAQRVREHEVEQLGVGLPAAGDLRRERRGRPGVHDVELADEADAAIGLGVARAERRTTGRPAATSSAGTMTAPFSPSASSSYQTGIGTPKKRWREMSQSPVRPPTQFS